MKMNFPLKNSHRRDSRKRNKELIVVVFVFVAGALFFSYFGTYVSNILTPIWHSNSLFSRGLSNLTSSLRSKDALISENDALKKKLASDEELITTLRVSADSRDELLSVYGRNYPTSIPANVLVHPPETPYDILVVDAGENLGVKIGSILTTPEGSSIGTITEIFSRISRVKLYTTAGERTDAVLERGGIPVTLVGRGGGNLELTVPKDVEVRVGDRILTPALDASLVAIVGMVDTTPTGSFKTILARSPINLGVIWHVLIKR
jgi:cell shape-determining protein MreC